MAIHPAPTPMRASRAVVGGRRGIPTRIALDMNDALAPCLEGIALADTVAAAVTRIAMAATAGSRMAVLNEANRLGHRALAARAEFRRLAAFIEDPEGDAA